MSLSGRARLPTRWTVFGGTVLVLLAGTLWLRHGGGPPPRPAPPAPPPYSVAVRPFLDLGPDTAMAALGPSLAVDLSRALGRVEGLRVADGASVRAATAASGDPREIGRRLSVGAVLEGALRVTGDRLRLTVHLVSVERGFDLWSETFERSLGELQPVRDSIARGIVGTLRPRVRPPGWPRTGGDAYLAYLRAGDGRDPGDDALERARAAFGDALRQDSAFAPAWAGLAEVYLAELLAGLRAPSELGPLADEAANRALEVDSLDTRALTVRGAVRYCYARDWPAAAGDLRRAALLDGNGTAALHWQSHLFVSRGLMDSSLAVSREAIERSPLDPALRFHLAWHYQQAGQDTLARAALARVPEASTWRDPHAAELAEVMVDSAAALAQLNVAADSAPERVELLAELARLHALAGSPEEARQLLGRLRSLADARYLSPYALAIVHAALGETRPALAAIGRALDERDPAAVGLPNDPRLASLRGDFRFAGLVRRLRPDYNPPTSTPRRSASGP